MTMFFVCDTTVAFYFSTMCHLSFDTLTGLNNIKYVVNEGQRCTSTTHHWYYHADIPRVPKTESTVNIING